jgi:hypothetical protein
MPATDTWLFPLAAVILGGVGTLVLVRGVFGRWFRAGGKAGGVRSCRRCRFDLSATEGHTCPECGHTARCEAEHYAGRFRWPVAALGLVLLLGAVAVAMTPGVRRDGWLHLLPMGVQVRVFHLESNDQSFWRFTERLEGRDPDPSAGAGIQLSFYNNNPLPHVQRWRDSSVASAAIVYARGRPDSDPATRRAAAVLDRYTEQPLDAAMIERMIEGRGIRDRRVKVAIVRRVPDPTPAIREARRALLRLPDDPEPVIDDDRFEMVRTLAAKAIALSEPNGSDIAALAEYLAAEPDEHDHVSRGQVLSHEAPASVWHAYAELVQAGKIGCEVTLFEGIRRSEFVAAAAIAWVADQTPERRARCLEILDGSWKYTGDVFRSSFATLRSRIAWASEGQTDLSEFVVAQDRWLTEWAMSVIQSQPDHAYRNALIALLGRSRFARPEAFRFATQTLWPDESIPLRLRVQPIMNLEGMPVDAHHDPADFTPYWEQILKRAALVDSEAAEVFDLVIDEAVSPPPPTLVIAVARRLAATPDEPEPWLTELARRIADDYGHPPTLSGFAKLVGQSAGHGPRQGRIRPELLTESAALAHTLGVRWAEP